MADNPYGVIMSAECGSIKTHDEHFISKGFLGFGRHKCGGYVHRHLWKLDHLDLGGRRTKRFLFTVNWKCHCGEFQSVNQRSFYSELLGRKWREHA